MTNECMYSNFIIRDLISAKKNFAKLQFELTKKNLCEVELSEMDVKQLNDRLQSVLYDFLKNVYDDICLIEQLEKFEKDN